MREGGTRGDHLRTVQRVTGKKLPELQIPPMPASLHFVYPMFRELSISGRRFSQGQPMLIAPSEVRAWALNHGCRLRSWELELLTILDHAWVEAMRAQETPT